MIPIITAMLSMLATSAYVINKPRSYSIEKSGQMFESMEYIHLELPTVEYHPLYHAFNKDRSLQMDWIQLYDNTSERNEMPSKILKINFSTPYKPASYNYGLKHSKAILCPSKFSHAFIKEQSHSSLSQQLQQRGSRPVISKKRQPYTPPSYKYGHHYTRRGNSPRDLKPIIQPWYAEINNDKIISLTKEAMIAETIFEPFSQEIFYEVEDDEYKILNDYEPKNRFGGNLRILREDIEIENLSSPKKLIFGQFSERPRKMVRDFGNDWPGVFLAALLGVLLTFSLIVSWNLFFIIRNRSDSLKLIEDEENRLLLEQECNNFEV